MKLLSLTLLLTITLVSCTKKNDDLPGHGHGDESNNPLKKYIGLGRQTALELQNARAATARYIHLENAIADGYVDIAVDVEEMGHHYMKQSLLNETFDVDHPEILVYNRKEDGTPYLVAVEYAIPISEPRPEGFTGNKDEWTASSVFQLWLLHAWVWEYNPEGVFNPTNPLIHLH